MNAPFYVWFCGAVSVEVTLEVTFDVLAPQILRIAHRDLSSKPRCARTVDSPASKWRQLMGNLQ